jgi:hypothetical protein
LEPSIAFDHVDPVPNLQTTDQRQHLVRRQVERVKRKSQVRLFDGWW